MPRLEQWSVCYPSGVDGHTAPEMVRDILVGNVYGSPQKFPDGTRVSTASIDHASLREHAPKVRTTDGSIWELGEPEPGFVEWCRENGHHVPTKEVPFKILEPGAA